MADTKRSDSDRIADLELALLQSRAAQPLGTLPDHGGGIGQEVEETWSLADQQMAQAGVHPLQDDDTDEGEKPKPPSGPAPTPHK